ncbi:MAG: PA domain-containing protein [Thermoanaerobaculia bacterium]
MLRRIALLSILALALAGPATAAKLTVRNIDAAGIGFNDPTPVAPVGGNEGTTLGQQRLNVFLAAAETWSKALESDVEIVIEATFSPITSTPCTETTGVLGHAGPQEFAVNFANAPKINVYYPVALANKLARRDLSPDKADIFVRFNSDVDLASCLGEAGWYYGLDRKAGEDWDLFVVVLHELGHGLGLSGPASVPQFTNNRPSIFETFIYDTTTKARWDQMTLAQREASLLNTGNIVWDGPRANTAARQWLLPTTMLNVSAPASIAGGYDIGTATFGPAVDRSSMNGAIVAALDEANGTTPSTLDACTTLTNEFQVAGKIALADRGECAFTIKARNAQTAGAIGIVIVDNRKEDCLPPGMAPSGDSSDIVIPVVSVRQEDGNLIRAQLASGVTAQLRTNASQLAGTAREGSVRLYTPCTVKPGSSLFHFDITASPNVLMEPDVNTDLLHGLDLTPALLMDLGWSEPARSGRRLTKR